VLYLSQVRPSRLITGWLNGFDHDDDDSISKKFDPSRDCGRPFTFAVGKGQIIRGWDDVFSTMQVGERQRLILPPRLTYGDRGTGGIIPGGATLYFDVELLGILLYCTKNGNFLLATHFCASSIQSYMHTHTLNIHVCREILSSFLQ
jgi:hypothetical protein